MKQVRDAMEYTDTQAKFMYFATDPESTFSHVMWFGGVRGGKSVAMIKAGWRLAMQYPNSHGLLTRKTLKELKSATLDSTVFGRDANMQDVIPKDSIAEHRLSDQQIIFKNGSKWSYFGADQFDRFQGMEFSYWMAEEVNRYPQNVYDYIDTTRICHPIGPHRVLCNSNTDTGQDYWYHTYFEDDTRKETHKAVLSSTLANAKFLPKEFLKQLEDLKVRDPLRYRVYVMSQFHSLHGMVYPQFNTLIHIIDPFELPKSWEICRGIDHGFSHFTVALDARIDYDGNVFIVDEYAEKGKTIRENADALLERGWNFFAVADPSLAKQKTQKDGRLLTIKDEYEEYGIDMVMGDNDVQGGLGRVRDHLYVDPERIHPLFQRKGAPKLFFFRGKCPVTVSQMQKYKLKENTDGLVNEEPVKEDDDGPDVVRYIINSRPRMNVIGMSEPERKPWEVPPWEKKRKGSYAVSPLFG